MTSKIRKLKSGNPLLNVARTMGRWLPSDDYLLITSVLHLASSSSTSSCFIDQIYRSLVEAVPSSTQPSCPFSHRFGKRELRERWHAILYDAPISKMVYANLKQLHEDDLLRLQRLVPFSECEDAILMTLYSSSVPFSRTSNTDESRNEDGQDADLHFFEQLLVKYRCFGNGSGFHAARTPLQLRHRYALFKKLGLLVDQEFELMTSTTSSSASGRILSTASVLNLNSDKREKENSEYGGNIDSMIQQEIEFDENIENEMSQEYELLQRQIRRAEVDVALWQIVCSSAVDKNRNGFNNDAKEGEDTLAVLFVLEEAGDYDQDESEETAGEKRKSCQGKSRCHYYYSMRKREIRAGRGSDCDLRLPSSTAMSRHQFSIQAAAAVDLKDTNDETLPAASVFYLINTGKRLMYVDGKPLRGAMQAAGSKNQVGARGDRSRLFDKSVIEIEESNVSMLFLLGAPPLLNTLQQSQPPAAFSI